MAVLYRSSRSSCSVGTVDVAGLLLPSSPSERGPLVRHFSERSPTSHLQFPIFGMLLVLVCTSLAAVVPTRGMADGFNGTRSTDLRLNLRTPFGVRGKPLWTPSNLSAGKDVSRTVAQRTDAPARDSGRSRQVSLLGMSEAQSVFVSLWPRFVADADSDSPGIISLTTPHLLRVLTGELECGCFRLYGDWTSYELTAPAQTKYPLSFLAEINNPTATIVVNGARTSAPVLTLAIFEKSSASASWVITRIVTTGNTAPWLSPTSSSTMAATPQPEPSQFVMGFSQLVAAMTSARNIGRVSPDNYWSRVGANEEPGAMFQELEGDHQADVAGHSTQVGGYTYSAPSAVFMTKLGPMECAYVLGTATYRGPNVEQPANRSAFAPSRSGHIPVGDARINTRRVHRARDPDVRGIRRDLWWRLGRDWRTSGQLSVRFPRCQGPFDSMAGGS